MSSVVLSFELTAIAQLIVYRQSIHIFGIGEEWHIITHDKHHCYGEQWFNIPIGDITLEHSHFRRLTDTSDLIIP